LQFKNAIVPIAFFSLFLHPTLFLEKRKHPRKYGTHDNYNDPKTIGVCLKWHSGKLHSKNSADESERKSDHRNDCEHFHNIR